MPVEFYIAEHLKPFDLIGYAERETVLCGTLAKEALNGLQGVLDEETVLPAVINNYPLRRNAVPYTLVDLYTGNKRRVRVYIRNPDGTPINITGALCVFTVRRTSSGPSAEDSQNEVRLLQGDGDL